MAKKKKLTPAEQYVRSKADREIINNMKEAITDGWDVYHGVEITPIMLAAAMEKEANTQDACVKAGESHPGFPHYLRMMAGTILMLEAQRLSGMIRAADPRLRDLNTYAGKKTVIRRLKGLRDRLTRKYPEMA